MRTTTRMRAKRRTLLGNERGSAFLTAVIFLVVLLGLGASFIKMSVDEVDRASRSKKENRALELAEAGLDYASWHIYNEAPTTLPFTLARTDFPEGQFSVIVDNYRNSAGAIVPNALQIVSTGASQGWTSIVKAVGHYQITIGTNSIVFENALFSNTSMNLKGNGVINGSIRANEGITITGNSTEILGPAMAGGKIIDDKGRIQGDLTPYAPKQKMPFIDTEAYKNDPTTQKYIGPKTFSGQQALSGIIFVEGDVNIAGQAGNNNPDFVLDGKCIIVATGNINFHGSAKLLNSDSELALVSNGNVHINGTATVEGIIYSHSVKLDGGGSPIGGGFLGNGTADIIGAVMADLIDISGTINVTYKKPTLSLPGSSTMPIQLDIVSWRRVR